MRLCVFARTPAPRTSIAGSRKDAKPQRNPKIKLSSYCVSGSTEIVQPTQYYAGMVIARRLVTVRKRYKKIVHNRGVNQRMFTKYMRQITNQSCPVVLSITETVPEPTGTPVIQRNDIHADSQSNTVDIYVRAREIYFRARRHRPVRAASIF